MFGKFKFVNNFKTTLAQAITPSSGTIRLVVTGYGQSDMDHVIEKSEISVFTIMDRLHDPSQIEIVYARAVSSNSLYHNLQNVFRGEEGTPARSWPKGSIVIQAITAGMLKYPHAKLTSLNVSNGLSASGTTQISGSANFGGSTNFWGDVVSNIGTTFKCNGRMIAPLSGHPASSSSPGEPGQLVVANGFLYVCISTNQWRRATLSTF